MKTKPKKLLIETSCVRVALNKSSPAHRGHFDAITRNGEIWSSVYVRGEFIRRWIVGYISASLLVEHFGTLDEALAHIAEDFSSRSIKVSIHALQTLLHEKGSINNCRSVSKELGRMAVRELKEFDRILKSRVSNSCKCQTGGKGLVVDYNRLAESLRSFVEAIRDFENCPVNEFLALQDETGIASRLARNPKTATTKSGRKLLQFISENRIINCRLCSQIGDAIIALEQPRAWELVHIDSDFDVLCAITGRMHIKVPSLRAANKEPVASPTLEQGRGGN